MESINPKIWFIKAWRAKIRHTFLLCCPHAEAALNERELGGDSYEAIINPPRSTNDEAIFIRTLHPEHGNAYSVREREHNAYQVAETSGGSAGVGRSAPRQGDPSRATIPIVVEVAVY